LLEENSDQKLQFTYP